LRRRQPVAPRAGKILQASIGPEGRCLYFGFGRRHAA